MSDLSRLSLNTATAKHATLAECTSACAEAAWDGSAPGATGSKE
ncbi:4-hydroxyphenylpyruvate dioxygenase [Cutibacterium acnes JCM 18920]|nr:4-hydroxyphenylpyruvate dioxygenase [Cutibacterium acnes JCM 18920]